MEVLFLITRGSASQIHCPTEIALNTEEGMKKYLRVTGSDWEQENERTEILKERNSGITSHFLLDE